MFRLLGARLATGKASISIPCYAERRYGGVADDEMLPAMPPDEFVRGMEGLAGISKVGLRCHSRLRHADGSSHGHGA